MSGSTVSGNISSAASTNIDDIEAGLLGASGIASFPAAAAAANGVSLAEVVRYLEELTKVKSATGEADLDISESDYTAFVNLVEIAPAASAPIIDAWITFDLDKSTTGFADQHTSETIQFAVARKVDGTNWTIDAESATTAISGTNADALGSRAVTLHIGPIGVTEDVRIYVVLSAENSVDVELPYVLYYRAASAPTVTPVAAA